MEFKQAPKGKEWLYVGHYIDTQGNYILKIGTTNDLKRRAQEHTRNYHKAQKYTMPAGDIFQYDWYIPLSRLNTLRYEERNRQNWQDLEIGTFVRNDRFCCKQKPVQIEVTIRKTYTITL